MGAELILFAVEIGGVKQKPNWRKGQERIASMSQKDLLGVWRSYHGQEIDEDHAELADQVRGQLENGLKQLEDAWNGCHRYGNLLQLKRSRVLALGGVSWGDEPFEGWKDVDLLGYAGDLLEEVGFR